MQPAPPVVSAPEGLLPARAPVLGTGRLRLRPFVPEDAGFLCVLLTDERVIPQFGYRMDPSIDAARQILLRWEAELGQGSGIRWVMEDRLQGMPAGFISLKDIHWGHHRCSTGYALLPACWGRGWAGEALDAVVDYGFTQLQLHRVQAEVLPGNSASRNLLIRSGFSYEGVLRGSYLFDGAYRDVGLYGRVRKE